MAIQVGYPNNYLTLTLTFNSRLKALKQAAEINQNWLDFNGTVSDFLESLNA